MALMEGTLEFRDNIWVTHISSWHGWVMLSTLLPRELNVQVCLDGA